METFAFRLVIRGTTPEGKRVRRVRTIAAPTFEEAWASFAEHTDAMSAGLTDVAHSVLPPVGWRVDGTVSAGFETE